MLTIIAICLGILTCCVLLVSSYLIFVLSSWKKAIDEIRELVLYIKGEMLELNEPISKGLDSIRRITEFIQEVSLEAKGIKNKVIAPLAFIFGIYAGIKAGLNILLKGGDKGGR